jgi:RHS repeat-associated protein
VFLALAPIDGRKGFNGLYTLVKETLQQEPTSGFLFVFLNKRRNRLKILTYDGSGLWLLTNPTPGRGGGAGPALGMPAWGVSEPTMAIWLTDTPLSYRPSRGEPMSLQLLYKGTPDTNLIAETKLTNIFSFGTNWFSPWKAYLRDIDGAGGFYYYNGLGGTISITNGGIPDYRTLITCSTNSGYTILTYPSGAQDLFGQLSVGADGHLRWFLSEHKDPHGDTTLFFYSTINGALCLTQIYDPDSKLTTLAYTNLNGYEVVTSVSDPCGHTASLAYDQSGASGSLANLTNIIDAVGLSNNITYKNGQAAALLTPYGTTTFAVLSSPPAVHVNELGLRDHLYVYIDSDGSGLVTNSLSAYAPSTLPYSNTLDTADSDQRDSFHWGPRQFAFLSPDFVSALNGETPVFNTTLLYATNYLHARLRHWLMTTNAGVAVLGQTLSLERNPSPDGVTPGEITWYDYAGKPNGNPEVEGTMRLPQMIAWKLPNGDKRFVRSERNLIGNATNKVETYTGAGSTVAVRTNTMTYAANNIDLLVLTNAAGIQASSNAFNAHHQVVTNFDALNQMTRYTYDGSQRLTFVQTPAGLTTSNYYGADGHLAQTIDLEIGRSNSFTWNNGLVYSQTDARGLTTTNTWDALNRLVKTLYPDGSYVTNVYTNLDLVKRIDRMGLTNRYDYNGFRQVIHSFDALNRSNNYSYCDCGTLSSVTDPLGATTTYAYDLAGRRTQTAGPDGYTVTLNYDLLGRVTNSTDSAGASATNWFNNQGLTIAVSNAFGCVQVTTYDIRDRATTNVDANGVSVSMTYDDLDRVLSRSYPDTGVESFGYSARGLAAHTSQLNFTNYYFYDAGGRKTSELNANQEGTQFQYTPAGDMTNLTDAQLQTTTWKFDQYGRATNKVDNLGTNLFIYAYDLNGWLTNRTSAAKGSTTYRYDAVGNLTNVVYPVSSNLVMAYDGMNRLTNLVDGVGTTHYAYDGAGQPLSEGGLWQDDTVSYTYKNRLIASVTVLAPNAASWAQTFAYDTARRLTNTTSPAGAFGYGFDSTRHQQVGVLNLPNGAYITNAYDSVARLLSTILKNSTNGALNSHSYAYNAANQRAGQTNTAGDYRIFGYDPSGQLTNFTAMEPGGVTNRLQEQLSYTYDIVGNLYYRVNNGLVETFTVNSLNELNSVYHSGYLTVAGSTTSLATNVTVNGANAALYVDNTFAKDGVGYVDGTNTFTAIAKDSYGRADTNTSVAYFPYSASFTYDANGNMLSDGTRNFAYDDENQLISVWTTNAWRSDFFYDGMLRLRIRREFAWASSTWVLTSETRYIYFGKLVIQERNAYNLPGITYTRGWDLSGSLQGAGGIDGLLARTDLRLFAIGDPAAHSYYHTDGKGNVTCMVNASQAVVASYRYDPFGNTISQSGTLADVNVYRFSSKESHIASGLCYYLHRFYDPTLGRWVNRDPEGQTDSPNEYVFALNSPLTFIDPFGDEVRRLPLDKFDPGDNRNRSGQFNRGCIGLCSWYQSEGCGDPQVYPENAPKTKCFSTKSQADSYQCSKDTTPFVFCKQGNWKDDKPPKPGRDGRVPNDSIGNIDGHFNYISCIVGKYVWMNWSLKIGMPMPTVIIGDDPPNAGGDYPNEIWCVTCKCKSK